MPEYYLPNRPAFLRCVPDTLSQIRPSPSWVLPDHLPTSKSCRPASRRLRISHFGHVSADGTNWCVAVDEGFRWNAVRSCELTAYGLNRSNAVGDLVSLSAFQAIPALREVEGASYNRPRLIVYILGNFS